MSTTQFLKYLNLAREHPAYYISLLDAQLSSFLNDKELPLSSEVVYETNDGKACWEEARKFLLQQKPLPPLIQHPGLTRAALEHQVDLSSNGIFGHTGSDNSTFSQRILRHCKKGPGAMAEIIGTDFDIEGRNTAEMTILSLIVDDGVKDRGHRKTIYNKSYRFVGFSSGSKDDKITTVFTLTENNLDLIACSSTANRPSEGWANQLQDITNNKIKHLSASQTHKHESSPRDGFGFSTAPLQKREKKIVEKIENVRTYSKDGAQIIETVTQYLYSDGSTEQDTERRTIYSD